MSKPLPRVTVLFEQNHWPDHVQDALKGKAQVAYQVTDFSNGAHMILDIVKNYKENTDFLAIDIPNDYDDEKIREITSYLFILPRSQRRKLFFGITENTAIYDCNRAVAPLSFLNTEDYPIVHWNCIEKCAAFGAYEIRHNYDRPKTFSKDWFKERWNALTP